MNVVDSSAWLEYFADGPNADDFAPAVEDTERLLVPTLVLFEVFKKFLRLRSEEDAFKATVVMQQGTVVDLNASLALTAAKLSHESGLALADASILATARAHRATLWTQDSDFEGMEGVEYRQKQT
jgi:toxin FitB